MSVEKMWCFLDPCWNGRETAFHTAPFMKGLKFIEPFLSGDAMGQKKNVSDGCGWWIHSRVRMGRGQECLESSLDLLVSGQTPPSFHKHLHLLPSPDVAGHSLALQWWSQGTARGHC